jgi:predicted RNA binding protein YcfA (HicA-like mRNA interferase family)
LVVSEQPTRKVLRELKDAGFVALRRNGQPHRLREGRGVVTVPDGHRLISPGVYRQTLKKTEEARG